MRTKRLTIGVVLALLCLTACSRRPRVVALPPPVAGVPPDQVGPLERADRAFNAGVYDEAARGYEDYLRLAPQGGQRDEALFRLGLTCVLRANPAPDWQRAAGFFRQVIDDYPNSPLKATATVILLLRSELDQVASDNKQSDERVRQLTAELDRLKKIDADRRVRP